MDSTPDETSPISAKAAKDNNTTISPQSGSIGEHIPNGSDEDGLGNNHDFGNLQDVFDKDFLAMAGDSSLSSSIMTPSILGYHNLNPPISDIIEAEL